MEKFESFNAYLMYCCNILHASITEKHLKQKVQIKYIQ